MKNETSRMAEEKKRRFEREIENSGRVKRTVFLAWANKGKMVLPLIIFVVILTAIFYVNKKNELSTVISLNYEQAAKGMNPNQTRFNIYEMKSEEVMERAIALAGLQEVIEPDELSEDIDIRETNSKKFDADDDTTYYISTSYIIDYKKNSKIKGITTYDMLNLICKAYNDYFHDNYVGNKSVLHYSLDDVDGLEYVEIGNYFTRITDQIIRYMDVRNEESPTFRSAETGETFQSLRNMVNNTKNYSVQKYISHVNETGLAKNSSHYLQTLLYRESMYDMAYKKSMIGYNVRKQGVVNYDSSMIGTVMIPSIDKNNEYYMSRTNTGTDYLAKAADEFLEDADFYKGEMLNNENIADNVATKSPTEADAAKADEMIKSIDKELRNLSILADKTDKDYLQYTTKDYLTFAWADVSIFSQINISYILICTFFFLLCMSMLFSFTYTIKKRQNEATKEREGE